jgi:Domain of unknown function (DUF4389)
MATPSYPVQLTVDYPDRPLNRLTTFFRAFTVIPIAIVLGALDGGAHVWFQRGTESARSGGTAAVGLLIFAPLLMIVFRQKYPRWWFDWNLNLLRFMNRVGVYAFLLDDRYPSTDDEQSVHLDLPYPDAERDLNRWLPLVKWLLVLPHVIVLVFLEIGLVVCVVIAWFAILFTGRFPRGLFDYIVGVARWGNRVVAYALIMVTDEYPPFRLAP